MHNDKAKNLCKNHCHFITEQIKLSTEQMNLVTAWLHVHSPNGSTKMQQILNNLSPIRSLQNYNDLHHSYLIKYRLKYPSMYYLFECRSFILRIGLILWYTYPLIGYLFSVIYQ